MENIKPKWTIIFMLSSENDLFELGLSAIEEIYKVGGNDKVNFILFTDFIPFNKFNSSFTKPSIFHVSSPNSFLLDQPVFTLEDEDLTKADNVVKMLTFVKDEFPAENFGFIYKGHGASGATDFSDYQFEELQIEIDKKILEDDKEDKLKEVLLPEIEKKVNAIGEGFEYFYEANFGLKTKGTDSKKINRLVLYSYGKNDPQYLKYHEISRCLKDVFGKVGFVALDCCWGQQIENATSFKSVTDNFIATTDESPATGIGYKLFCEGIIRAPKSCPEEIAKLLVAGFFYQNYRDYDSEIEHFTQMGVSLSYVKCPSIDLFLSKFGELIDGLSSNIEKYYAALAISRSKCLDYTYQQTETLKSSKIEYPIFNIDLIWFLMNLKYFIGTTDKIIVQIDEVLSILNNSVIGAYIGTNYQNPILGNNISYTGGFGITICFPFSIEHYQLAKEQILGMPIAFYEAVKWRDFLKEYYACNKSEDIMHLAKYFTKDDINRFVYAISGEFPDWKLESGAALKSYSEAIIKKVQSFELPLRDSNNDYNLMQ